MRTVCVVNTLAGNYAFLPSEYSGVLIVDLSDPWNPKMCTSFSTPGFAIRAAVDAPYLFVADMMKGLRIANIEIECWYSSMKQYDMNWLNYALWIGGLLLMMLQIFLLCILH